MQKKRFFWIVVGLVIVLAFMFTVSRPALQQRDVAISQAKAAQATSAFAVSEVATAQEQLQEAQRQTSIARAGELEAQSLYARDKNFPLSILLGIEFFRTLDIPLSRSALLQSVEAQPQLLRFLDDKATSIYSLAYSPDGKMLVVVACGAKDELGNCAQSTIRLWSVPDGEPLGQLTSASPSTAQSESVVFSPDGKTLATGSDDGSIVLWDVATKQPIGPPLRSSDHGESPIAFSPDGKILASASSLGNSGEGGSIDLWDVASQRLLWSPPGTHFGPFSLAFSPDGKTLFYLGWTNDFIGWDVATHTQVRHSELKGNSTLAGNTALSPDGKIAAEEAALEGGNYGIIILWDTTTGQPIDQPIPGDSISCGSSLAFSPDGKTLASTCSDGSIILWDLTQPGSLGMTLETPAVDLSSLTFSPDGKTLAAGGTDGTLSLWAVSSQSPLGQQLKGPSDDVAGIAFSPDNKTVAFNNFDGTILLWDVATQHPIGQPLEVGSEPIDSMAFSPDGKMLASGSLNGTIILWNAATGQRISQPFAGHSHVDLMDSIQGMAFSPDGKILASGNYNGSIILWDAATGQSIGGPLAGITGYADSVAFSPDGKTLAAAGCGKTDGGGDCTEGEITLWNVASGQRQGQPIMEDGLVMSRVIFSPDGKTLAAATGYGSITLWDVATEQSIGQLLSGDTAFGLSSVAFSPDGKTLAGSGYGKVFLWDVVTRQLLSQLPTTKSTVSRIAFSPDGKILASGSDDGTITLWNMEPQMWIERACLEVGRNFTQSEWQQYFPGEAYRATCPEWPSDIEAAPTPTSTATP